jgi:hypothetical protein
MNRGIEPHKYILYALEMSRDFDELLTMLAALCLDTKSHQDTDPDVSRVTSREEFETHM